MILLVFGSRLLVQNTMSLGEVHSGSGCLSGIWKGILSVLEPFSQSICFHVGKGDRVRFWLDTWIGDSLLATQFSNLFRCAQNWRALVIEFIERVGGRTTRGPTFRRIYRWRRTSSFARCSPLLKGFIFR
eukprot:TRINITY_DN5634_c0_g1_i1.p1 TRINITY_DN5634_c0_g1~~TRINITY_DN5634_c0_g1_i1.p1  ORF type:complete len:130 (-),score=6.45 TRINITY_DN5634_c0_g1_i1:1155-1544(-)